MHGISGRGADKLLFCNVRKVTLGAECSPACSFPNALCSILTTPRRRKESQASGLTTGRCAGSWFMFFGAKG